MRRTVQNINNDEFKKQLKKYRFITLIPLVLGMIVTLLLIWLDLGRKSWGLLYFALIIAMMPLILKSGRLHREWRRRRRV